MRSFPIRLAVAALVALALPAGAQRTAADSAAVRRLGRDVLRELIAINTTDAGSTTAASEALAARFRAAGWPAEDVLVIGQGEKSRNLVVRWRGRAPAGRKPIVVLAHLDVVEALRSDWTHDPFALTERDGWLYGRGTVDDKGAAAQAVAAFLSLRAEGWQPARDVVLALTAGEETGTENGVQWLLGNRRDLVDAEYVLNLDAGGGELRGGKPVAMQMQLAEKVYWSLTLTARSPGGHSSLPAPDNAIYRLAAALGRLSRYTFPPRATPVVREYFRRMAPLVGGAEGSAMRVVAARPADPAALAALSRWPVSASRLRTTCVATMLSGGHAENALPQTARATVNCRLLPDEDTAAVRRTLARVVADTGIAIAPVDPAVLSPASEVRRDVMDAVARAMEGPWGTVPVVPFMENGATDGLFFRNAGIPVYAVLPFFMDPDENRAHGKDERIPAAELERGVEFMRRVLPELAGR